MNHTYRLVWNRALSMFVAVSECTRSMGKSGGAKPIGGAALAVAMLAALPLAAQGQTSSFLDFTSLDGWTTQGTTTLLSGSTSYIMGTQLQTLAPAAGNSMVRITTSGSTVVGATNADAALGLSWGTISSLLGLQTTNFGILSKTFTFNPGTYSFAWAYAASDAQPYNDGVLFSVVGQGTQNVVSLARNGASVGDKSGPQAATLVLGSMGSTGWMTTSFNIATAGSYQVSYADYNWLDTSVNPVYYVSGVAGAFTGTAIVPPGPVPIGLNTTALASGLAAGTVAPAFDGGSLLMDVKNGVYAQDFTISSNGGTIGQGGNTSTFNGVFSGPGGLRVTDSSAGGAVKFTAANTYAGDTVISKNATLALVGAGALSNSAVVDVQGVFDLSGAAPTNAIKSLWGDGSVILGSNDLALTNGSGYFTGNISGTGGIAVLKGQQTLTGVNTYTGVTQVAAGGILDLDGKASIANSRSVIVDGLLYVGAATAPVTITSLGGSGFATIGANTLTLSGAHDTFSGRITGTGGVTIAAGTETFTGTNIYSGDTVVNGKASLILAGKGSIVDSRVVLNGGLLDISANNNDVAIRGLSGDGGSVTLGARTLTSHGAAGAFGGTISGTGGLTVANGNQILTAAQAYTGVTRIESNGILTLRLGGSIGNSSSVVLDGTLDMTGAYVATAFNNLSGKGLLSIGNYVTVLRGAGANFAGNIAGDGSVNIDATVQTFSGKNTYTGVTQIAGTSTLALAGAGSVANSFGVIANGVFDVSAATGTPAVKALYGTGSVNLGSKTLALTGTGSSFRGTIGGTGGMAVMGGEHVLLDANTYTGTTQVVSGAMLALIGKGSIASSTHTAIDGVLDVTGASGTVTLAGLGGAGQVELGANSMVLNGLGGAFTGTIVGSGGVHLAAGTELLSGVNTYTGATQVDRFAKVSLLGTGSIASSSSVILNGGRLDIAGTTNGATVASLGGADGTVTLGYRTLTIKAAPGTPRVAGDFGGDISGAGGVFIDATTQTFSGQNGYTGMTEIGAASTLALAGIGSISNSSAVAVSGVLDLSAAAPVNAIQALYGLGSVNLGGNTLALAGRSSSFGGTIDGTGGLAVLAGVHGLTGVNTYTGTTQVASGATLSVSGSIAGSARAMVDGTLAVGSLDSAFSVGSLGGSGTVYLGATGLVLGSASDTFSGTIISDGDAGLTVAAGTETLTGVNTYAGATVVKRDASLVLAGAGSIAGSRSVVLDGGQLDIAATTAGASIAGLAGTSGLVRLGANTLTLTAANAIYGGNITGTGGLRVAGGVQTINAGLSYTGATQVDAGAQLIILGSGNIASSGNVLANGAFDISGAAGAVGVGTLTGTGTVQLGANGLVLTAAAGSFGGVIAGSGGVAVASGTATLTGVNSYTGVTQIGSGATLAIAGGGAIATSSGVVNNGTLTIASTLPAVMTSLAGSGTLNLLDQSVTFTQGADNFTGNITGTGSMNVAGGTLQLSGVNTLVGRVGATSGGTLRVASDASLGAAGNAIVLDNGTLNTTAAITMARAVSITGTGTAAVDSGTTLTSSGALTGSGTLVKTGAGTLVLGGDNTALQGGAIINGGAVTLASNSGAGSGAVRVNAGMLETAVNLTLAQNIGFAGGTSIRTDAATTAILSGTVSTASGGNGCVTKTGAGTLDLRGAASFSGGLCLEEGTLRANGLTTAGLVAVGAGATLHGSGTVSGPVVVTGTLAPGNSPGTLTASSTVTMLAGSTFQEDINGTGTGSGPGNYARLVVTGAGQFVAGGATLAPNLVGITGAATYTPYVPQLGESYRIVTAAGGLVGRFGTLVQPAGLAAGTRLAAFYNGDGSNSIELRVLPSSYRSHSAANGGNRNAQVTGGVLDRILTADQAGAATAAQAGLGYAVSNVGAASVAAVTQNLGGEVHGAMAAVAPLAGQAVQGAVLKQMDAATPGAASALWADLAGNRAEWRHDADASGFVANRGQLTLGVDAFRNDTGRIGVGYAHARANVAAAGGSGTLRENVAFVYGRCQGAGVGIDAMAGAGRTNWQTERANPLGAGALRSGIDGRSTLASIGLSTPWQAGGTVQPFVRVLWQRIERDAGGEGTAAVAALALNDYAASGTRATAGLAGNVNGGAFGRTPWTMQYSVGVGRDNGNLARASIGSNMAGIDSTILAPQAGRAFVQAAVSGVVLHSENASSYYGVSSEVHSGRIDASLSGGLRYAF